jgi:hypothetical protein
MDRVEEEKARKAKEGGEFGTLELALAAMLAPAFQYVIDQNGEPGQGRAAPGAEGFWCMPAGPETG